MTEVAEVSDGERSMRRLAVLGLVACVFGAAYLFLVGALMYVNVVVFNPYRRDPTMWWDYWIGYIIFYSPSVAAALLASWYSRLPLRGVSVLLGIFLCLITAMVQWTLLQRSGGGALLITELAVLAVVFHTAAVMCRWSAKREPRT
jgi:hypothetical protein